MRALSSGRLVQELDAGSLPVHFVRWGRMLRDESTVERVGNGVMVSREHARAGKHVQRHFIRRFAEMIDQSE